MTAPFEPLESASERILTLKVVLLLALTSLKRVGDLQDFSVSETCMDFALGLFKVTLRPRPGYIPKVATGLPRQSRGFQAERRHFAGLRGAEPPFTS